MRSFGIKVFAALVQLCIITRAAHITIQDGTTFDICEASPSHHCLQDVLTSLPGAAEIDAWALVQCGSPDVPNCREGTETLCDAGCRSGVKNWLTSVHNCEDSGASAYLCLVNGVAYCVKPNRPGAVVGTNTEGGRCFS